MDQRIIHITAVSLLILFPIVIRAQEEVFQSYLDESLKYPVRVVEAQARWQPGTRSGSEGNFKVALEELGTVATERVRLPVPGSAWRLDGRVGRAQSGTLFAGFGTFLYWSKDEGRTWTGKLLQHLPDTRGERVTAQA